MSEVQRIYIPSTDGLDPIILYFEQWRSPTGNCNSGSITAVCYGEAWNFIAGNFGERSIVDFIKSCNKGYLGGKFAYGVPHFTTDFDKIGKKIGFDLSSEYEVGLAEKAISNAFGPDFANDLPEIKNPKFEYVERVSQRIIDHLQSETAVIAA